MTTSDAPTPEAVHLHLDDYPEALRLLARLLSRRTDNERLGCLATEHGAWVDWGRLTTTAPLSSTEVAAVHIARGCAGLERAGGATPKGTPTLTTVLLTAFAACARQWGSDSAGIRWGGVVEVLHDGCGGRSRDGSADAGCSIYRGGVTQPEDSNMDARVAEREDLVERIGRGDGVALAELLEHATGATPRSVKVTVPRPGAPAAGG